MQTHLTDSVGLLSRKIRVSRQILSHTVIQTHLTDSVGLKRTSNSICTTFSLTSHT